SRTSHRPRAGSATWQRHPQDKSRRSKRNVRIAFVTGLRALRLAIRRTTRHSGLWLRFFAVLIVRTMDRLENHTLSQQFRNRLFLVVPIRICAGPKAPFHIDLPAAAQVLRAGRATPLNETTRNHSVCSSSLPSASLQCSVTPTLN